MPIALFSHKIKSLDQVSADATVAIVNDPVNGRHVSRPPPWTRIAKNPRPVPISRPSAIHSPQPDRPPCRVECGEVAKPSRVQNVPHQ
ncbi:MetQ/NlpA family ABC transporter substrate-binding protein [Acidisphaera sp. S103]|uniref:MetQ/NlpA family ABC transporter substrate-binding protein n=1 Tax=Acidisphaera sp. S103 TaxID=1747223 RepID=UPI00131C15B0